MEKLTQPEYSDVLRAGTFVNIVELLNGIDNRMAISKSQNQELADSFEEASSTVLLADNKITDFICAPPDIMAYEIFDNDGSKRLKYSCAEINGTGFAGMRALPQKQLETITVTYSQAAQEIKTKCEENEEIPLMIIAYTGRVGSKRENGKYPTSSNNKMIWEMAFIADKCAEQLGSPGNPCYAESFDKIASPYFQQIDKAKSLFDDGILNEKEYNDKVNEAFNFSASSMRLNENNPIALVGYLGNFVECCKIEDGRPFLFGRPVNGIIHDRVAFNLQKKERKILNHRKVHVMNATIDEGANKLSCTLARHNFHSSMEAKNLPLLAKSRGFTYDVGGLDKLYHFKDGEEDLELINSMSENERQAHRMTYFRGVTENEGIDGIMIALDDFLKLNLKPLFKPCGTSQSKGIIGYRTNESRNKFRQRFLENLTHIENLYGKCAGFPFLVMPILKLAKAEKFGIYDMRYAIYKKLNGSNQPTIHCIPHVLKKLDRGNSSDDKNVEFTPTNVSRSIEKTGRPGADFVVPLCKQDILEEVQLTNDRAKSICLYLSAFQNWLLKTYYCN